MFGSVPFLDHLQLVPVTVPRGGREGGPFTGIQPGTQFIAHKA